MIKCTLTFTLGFIVSFYLGHEVTTLILPITNESTPNVLQNFTLRNSSRPNSEPMSNGAVQLAPEGQWNGTNPVQLPNETNEASIKSVANTSEASFAGSPTTKLSNVTEDKRQVEVLKDKSKPGANNPVNIVSIPVPGKPEFQVQPPASLDIVSPGKPDIEFVKPPDVEIQLMPVPKPISIPSLPEVDISPGPSTVFQIPLLPHISFANPFEALFGNFTTFEIWKPFGGLDLIDTGNKPPKPLYAKIQEFIQKLQGKVVEVTGLGTVLPNSTTIQTQALKLFGVLKILMMDTPF